MRWRPIAPPTVISLSTTWRQLGSASKKLGNNPPIERRLSVQKDRFEESRHGRCPWHPKSKHSAFKCQTLWRALGALPFNKDYEERGWDFPNNDLFIN
jgi:hypothetical protein